MTTAAYSAHPVLAPVTEGMLPLLALLAIALPAIAWHNGRLRDPGLFYICALGSVALLYLLRAIDYKLLSSGVIVHEQNFKFSSHSALAISLCITLAAFRPLALPILAAVLGGYFWLIVFLHYHAPYDIYGTFACIFPVSGLCHMPWLVKGIKQNEKPRP